MQLSGMPGHCRTIESLQTSASWYCSGGCCPKTWPKPRPRHSCDFKYTDTENVHKQWYFHFWWTARSFIIIYNSSFYDSTVLTKNTIQKHNCPCHTLNNSSQKHLLRSLGHGYMSPGNVSTCKPLLQTNIYRYSYQIVCILHTVHTHGQTWLLEIHCWLRE